MTLALLPLALVSLTVSPSSGPLAGEDPFRRALREATRRAQQKLIEEAELHVDHSTWEDPWVVESENYVVRTTDSYYLAADIGAGLDTMLGHFRALLGSEFDPPDRMRVLILPDLAAYNSFGDDHGAEHSSFYGSFFPAGHPEFPVAAMHNPNPTLLRMFITHSAVHQFVHYAYPRAQPPTWLSEGLAAYFSLFWDSAYGEREIRALVAKFEPTEEGGGSLLGRLLGRGEDSASGGDYIPLPELLNAPLSAYTDRSHARLIELGMLFTYLVAFREDTRTTFDNDGVLRAPFAEYLRAMLEGGDFRSMPVHALLHQQTAQLDADFRAYYSR